MHNAGLFNDRDMIRRELDSHNELDNGEVQFKKMLVQYGKLKSELVSTEEFFKYLKL
jgi:hypothetical protein